MGKRVLSFRDGQTYYLLGCKCEVPVQLSELLIINSTKLRMVY
jgi:hypothetical protein